LYDRAFASRFRLYGVDAPAHWEAYSIPLSKPNTGFKGGGFATGGIKRIWEKVVEVDGSLGRGETEREREAEGEGKGTGNGNSALVAGNRRLCQWGPGQSPGRKTNFMYLGVTKHFWLIDNLIYNTGLRGFYF